MRDQEREQWLESLADRYVLSDGERLQKEMETLDSSGIEDSIRRLDRRAQRRRRATSWRRMGPALGAVAACLVLVVLLPQLQRVSISGEQSLSAPLAAETIADQVPGASMERTESAVDATNAPAALAAAEPPASLSEAETVLEDAPMEFHAEKAEGAPAALSLMEESGEASEEASLAGQAFPFALPEGYTVRAAEPEGSGSTFHLENEEGQQITWQLSPVRSATPIPKDAQVHRQDGSTFYTGQQEEAQYLVFDLNQVRHTLTTQGDPDILRLLFDHIH